MLLMLHITSQVAVFKFDVASFFLQLPKLPSVGSTPGQPWHGCHPEEVPCAEIGQRTAAFLFY